MDPRTLDNETTEKLGGHGYYARIARQRSIAPTQHHGWVVQESVGVAVEIQHAGQNTLALYLKPSIPQ